MSHTKIEIIFDNGGGVTLQTADGFVHHYSDARQAAQDAMTYVDTGSSKGWEGNEPEHRVEVTDEQIRSGGYRVFDQDDVRDYLHVQHDGSWQNVTDFFGSILTSRA